MRTELQMWRRARRGEPTNGPNYLDAASRALLRSIEAASHLEDWVKHEFYYYPHLLQNPDLVAAVKSSRVPMRTWNTLKREEQRLQARLYGDPIDHFCSLSAADWLLDPSYREFGPPLSWTKKQRRNHGTTIHKLASRLQQALEVVECKKPSDWPGTAFEWNDINHMLLSIKDAADAYTNSEPPLLKPTEEGAAKTHYIRELGKGFNRRYGKPLPQVVQDLASLYFPDIGNMDESGVRRRIGRQSSKRQATKRSGK